MEHKVLRNSILSEKIVYKMVCLPPRPRDIVDGSCAPVRMYGCTFPNHTYPRGAGMDREAVAAVCITASEKACQYP